MQRQGYVRETSWINKLYHFHVNSLVQQLENILYQVQSNLKGGESTYQGNEIRVTPEYGSFTFILTDSYINEIILAKPIDPDIPIKFSLKNKNRREHWGSMITGIARLLERALEKIVRFTTLNITTQIKDYADAVSWELDISIGRKAQVWKNPGGGRCYQRYPISDKDLKPGGKYRGNA